METKFQTSFIPKKPITTDGSKTIKSSSGGTSIFMIIGTLVFIASIAGAVFSVVWKKVLISAQEGYKVDLARNEESFNIGLIENLKKASAKLDLTKKIVRSHLSTSELFNIIGGLTIEGVRFDSLNYEGPGTEASALAKFSMKGIATSYSSVAYQSDVFGKSDTLGTNKAIKNPLLSDMTVDANGYVTFNFSANIDPILLNYEKVNSFDKIIDQSQDNSGKTDINNQPTK